MEPISKMVDYREIGTLMADFGGLFTNQGRIATDKTMNTSQEQRNLVCVAPGQITTRPGIRKTNFDEDA